MAAPDKPTLLRPAAGEIVIPGLPVFLQKSSFSDPDAGILTAPEFKSPTTDEGGYWINPSFLRTGSGMQNTMATATAPGVAQLLSWSGLSFSGTSTNRVKEVILRLRAMATWRTPPATAGHTEVRVVLSHKKVRLQVGGGFYLGALCRSTQWTGVGPVPADGLFTWDITAALASILGPKFTLGDLAGIGADLRALVSVWFGVNHYVTTWYAGPLQLQVTSWSTEPSRQFAYQFDFGRTAGAADAFSTGQNNVDRDTYTIPALRLEADYGKTLYGRVRVHDGTSWSAYSDTVTFSTLNEHASKLLTERGCLKFAVLECEWCLWLDVGAWTKTAGRTYVWECAHDPASMLTSNWWTVDVEEEGIRQGYTAKASVAEVDANASSFWADAAAKKFYIRTSDGRAPGAFKGAGVGLLVAFPIGAGWIGAAGKGNTFTFEGRASAMPDVVSAIDDLGSGIGGSASSTLRLSNFDGLFDKLMVDRDPSVEAGLLMQNRRVRMKLIGQTSAGTTPYGSALTLWEGVGRWSSSGAHAKKEITLQLVPRDVIPKGVVLAGEKYDSILYPNLRQSDVGRSIDEAIGVGHLRVPCAVVDTVNKYLRPARSVSAVANLYCRGVVVPKANWIFDATTGIVSLVNYATWAADKDADWSTDCDGESFEGAASMLPGKLARYLLQRAGIRASEIHAPSFTLIDTTTAPYALRFVQSDSREIRDILQTTLRSGRFHLTYRFDGLIEAVPDDLAGCHASTPVFTDGDVIEDPVVIEEDDTMGSWAVVSYWGYPDPATKLSEWSAGSWLTRPWFQIDGEKRLETFHASSVGAQFASGNFSLNAPRRTVRFLTWTKGLAAQVGKGAILNLSQARDARGLYRNQLFQVRKARVMPGSGNVELILRDVKTLTGYEGPS